MMKQQRRGRQRLQDGDAPIHVAVEIGDQGLQDLADALFDLLALQRHRPVEQRAHQQQQGCRDDQGEDDQMDGGRMAFFRWRSAGLGHGDHLDRTATSATLRSLVR